MKFVRQFNWISFAATLALIALGTVAIWSSGNARAETVFHGMWINNLTTAIFGLVLYFVLAAVDYRRFLELFSWPLYGLSLVMLVAVLCFGSEVLGGRRWLWFFQPSEISKLFLLCLVAALLGHDRFQASPLRTSFKGFLFVGALVGVPCLLILAEPDLGTTLTLVPAIVLMMFVAGVWRKGLVPLLVVGAVGAMAILGAVYEAEKPGVSPERREQILKYTPLKPHQVKRVKVFLFPETDPQGAGYNQRQAKNAIGSGGYRGAGIGQGRTNRLKYLPPAVSMNDFIFCVYAEETGYRGSLFLLALYAALLLPMCWVAAFARDLRGRLLALGFALLIFAHVYVNIGMSIGLLPITGLPLPFVSSGRTFLVTVLCGLGLVQSVSLHRDEGVT